LFPTSPVTRIGPRHVTRQEVPGHLQRAVDLNPDIAICHSNLALACIHFNRPDDAIVHLDAAAILAQRGYLTHMALVYKALAHYVAGRFEQALQVTEEALQLFPCMFTLKDKAVFCEKPGRHEDALAAIRQLRAAEPAAALEGIERSNALVFPPETVREMNWTLRKVWLETPPVPQTHAGLPGLRRSNDRYRLDGWRQGHGKTFALPLGLNVHRLAR
jgi:tetratricopeptide (TPR) repeat protein